MLVVGIDGGGTKTEGVVMNEAGEVVARARSGSTNLNFVPVAECERSVAEVCAQLGGDGRRAAGRLAVFDLHPRPVFYPRGDPVGVFPTRNGIKRRSIARCWRRVACWSRMVSGGGSGHGFQHGGVAWCGTTRFGRGLGHVAGR
jgi:hypothetical protein